MRAEQKEKWSKAPLVLMDHKNLNSETYNDKVRRDETL